MQYTPAHKHDEFGKRIEPPAHERTATGGTNKTGPNDNTKRGNREHRIASLKSTIENPIPRVTLESPQLGRATEFMLDTGAQPNLIKESMLKPGIEINAKKRLTLQGITERRIETLGSTYISIAQKPVEFYIVPDSFPVTAEGLLGSSFCSSGVTISYPEQQIKWGNVIIPFINNNVSLPARSVSCISLTR